MPHAKMYGIILLSVDICKEIKPIIIILGNVPLSKYDSSEILPIKFKKCLIHFPDF